MSNLTKGTLEWKEAVLKVNQQVLDLIEKYPELAQYMTNTDGVLGISEEGLDKVVQKQLNAAYATQSAVLSDQRNLAQTRANQENKLKSIDVLTIDQNTKEQTKKVLDTNAQARKRKIMV